MATKNNELVISKKIFIDFFTIPSFYWFKTSQEIKKINQALDNDPEDGEQENDEFIEDWLEQNFSKLLDNETVQLLFNNQNDSLDQKLTQLLTKADLDLNKNFFFFYHQFCNALNQFIRKQFNHIRFEKFYDHRVYNEACNSTERFWKLMDSDDDWIIFNPKLQLDQFLLNPTYLIRSKNKIYYIEAHFSSNQRLVNVLPLIFAEKVLQNQKAFKVDCYLTCLICSSVTGISSEQFILSAHFPLGKKVTINHQFAKSKKQAINHFISKINNDQINYYCRLYGKKFHFLKDPDPDLMVIDLLNRLKVARPIKTSFSYLWFNEKTGITVERFWNNQLKVFNINDLLDKKLTIEDYPINLDEHEIINTYYNNGLQEMLKGENYSELLKDSRTRNQLLTLIGLVDPELLKQVKNNKLCSWPVSIKMKIKQFQWDAFLANITNHWNKYHSEQLPVVNQRYWLENYDVNNIFNKNFEWKNLLIKFFPSLNFSGNWTSLVKIYQKINKLGLDFDLSDHQAVEETFLINPIVFDLYGFDQQYLITFKALDRMTAYQKVNNRIYYDFETYSLAINNISNMPSYAQIVYQASIIKDLNGSGIKACNNLVYDPLKINSSVFKEIIDAIYHPDQNTGYIIYNKSFENNRLIEMAKQIDEEAYYQKVQVIINNTIDLADFFSCSRNNIQIVVKDLKGFYSIKKVIEIIPQKYLKQAQAISYKNLEKIQNGLICQKLAINRALDHNITELKEKAWLEQVELMKKYCENDVRSMIAIEYWMYDLLQQASAAKQVHSEQQIADLIFNKRNDK